MTDTFPYISSEDLDDTEWGKSLVEEFGRVTAEKLAMFLNKNGVSFTVPITLGKLNMGIVKVEFFDSDYQQIKTSNRDVRYCNVFINDKEDRNVKSISIPKLIPRQRHHYKIKIEYSLSGNKQDSSDEEMEDIDFDKLHTIVTKTTESLDDDLFDEGFKLSIVTNIVNKYLTEIKSDVIPSKVIDILNSL